MSVPIIPAKGQQVKSQVQSSGFRDFSTESISLKMTAKGSYYWDISVNGSPKINEEEVKRLISIDKSLKEAFPKNTMIDEKKLEDTIERLLDKISRKEVDPYSAADEILGKILK